MLVSFDHQTAFILIINAEENDEIEILQLKYYLLQ